MEETLLKKQMFNSHKEIFDAMEVGSIFRFESNQKEEFVVLILEKTDERAKGIRLSKPSKLPACPQFPKWDCDDIFHLSGWSKIA